jgi:DNA-binding CsgD family transcriptional regulator
LKSEDQSKRSRQGVGSGGVVGRPALTRREREILGLLAEGMSGAQIAGKLVLSPETVRTHVRNAMAKLGASTRSQAVVMAMQSNEIAGEEGAAAAKRAATPEQTAPGLVGDALATMLDGLVSLYDVGGGAVYLAEEDGLSLHRAAAPGAPALEIPDEVALGNGPLGRAALDRRAQLLQDPTAGPSGAAMIAAPMLGGGKLLGVIALAARGSRPVGRNEILLLQAFATRVGDVLIAGNDVERRLERAMERFRASWSAATRVA